MGIKRGHNAQIIARSLCFWFPILQGLCWRFSVYLGKTIQVELSLESHQLLKKKKMELSCSKFAQIVRANLLTLI